MLTLVQYGKVCLEDRKDFQEDASLYSNYIIRDGVGIFPVGGAVGIGGHGERG